MDNLILTVHPQSNVYCLCEQHFKSKEKVSTITSLCFNTLKEYAKKRTAVEKGPSSFQNFYLILDKCNTITAESLENETVKCHLQCRCDFTNDIKLNNIKTTNKRKEEISMEIIVELQQEEPSDIRMHRKSKEIMEEKK